MNEDFNAVSSLLANLQGDKFDDEFEFLIKIINKGTLDDEPDLLLSVLAELADYQWNTYELLPNAIRTDLGKSIIKVWNRNSLDSTEKLVGIVAKLGLGKALSYLTLAAKEISNSDVRQEIASAVIEFSESVDDPYSGLK